MLMRSDPFRELDRLTQQVLGSPTRPAFVPMDAYRRGDEFVVHFDLPGVEPSSIDLRVENDTLTVSAERRWEADEETQILASERPQGSFSRQLFLGDGIDPERIQAGYDQGVLTVRLPVAEQARARKVHVDVGARSSQAIDAKSSAA